MLAAYLVAFIYAFNSLSRDHEGVLYEFKKRAKYTFNSLSRDHPILPAQSGIQQLRSFQLPLSGSLGETLQNP